MPHQIIFKTLAEGVTFVSSAFRLNRVSLPHFLGESSSIAPLIMPLGHLVNNHRVTGAVLASALYYGYRRGYLSAFAQNLGVKICAMWQHAFSSIMRRWGVSQVFPEDMRRAFRVALSRSQIKKPSSDHSHATCAAVRGFTYNVLDQLKPSFQQIDIIQAANRDLKKFNGDPKVHLSSTYHWTQDVVVPPSREVKSDLKVVIDTDHYLDMPSLLAQWRQCVLIYTFQPRHIATTRAELGYSFAFGTDNTVTYVTSGTGDVYKHKVWNYTGSFVLATTWFGGCNYHIERREIDEDHCVIMLIPSYTLNFLGVLCSKCIASTTLKRIEPALRNGFFRLDKYQEGKPMTSIIGKAGSDGLCMQATSTSSTANLMCAALRLDSYQNATAAALNQPLKDEPCANADLIMQYHKQCGQVGDAVSQWPSTILHNYEYGSFPDPDGKIAGQPTTITTPVPTFVPMSTQTNSIEAVADRIIKQEQASALLPDVDKLKYPEIAREFVDFLKDVQHSMGVVLWTPERVQEHFELPKHKREMAQSAPMFNLTTTYPNAQMFMKKESYFEIKTPRPIINESREFKYAYSQVGLALAELLHHVDWYAFAHTPREIGEGLIAIAARSDFVAETDFSRFDGSIAGLRAFEGYLLDRLFGSDAVAAWSTQLNSIVKGDGFEYRSAGARHSGSAETSSLNSLDNAFIMYCGNRAAGLDPRTAMRYLGMYGGDDGITPLIGTNPTMHAHAIEKIASEHGLTLKLAVKHREVVGFLGRWYGELWSGSANSCSDIPRALSHLNWTSAAQADPKTKTAEKLQGYFVTDPHTPGLKYYYKFLIPNAQVDDEAWWANIVLKTTPFQNDEAPWMIEKLEEAGYALDASGQPYAVSAPLPDTDKPVVLDGVPIQADQTVNPRGIKITRPLTVYGPANKPADHPPTTAPNAAPVKYRKRLNIKRRA